jgi:hypothetical protein
MGRHRRNPTALMTRRVGERHSNLVVQLVAGWYTEQKRFIISIMYATHATYFRLQEN